MLKIAFVRCEDCGKQLISDRDEDDAFDMCRIDFCDVVCRVIYMSRFGSGGD